MSDPKLCRKCGEQKPVKSFYTRPDGHTWGPCVDCTNQKRRERRPLILDRIKRQKREYYQRNRIAILKRAHDRVSETRIAKRIWTSKNPSKIKAQKKRHYWKHRDRLLAKKKAERRPLTEKQKIQIKAWNEAHPERVRESARLRARKRLKTDPDFRLLSAIRCQLRSALRSQSTTKNERTLRLLGCSIDSFRIFIATKFQSGMSWDNYGPYWELDHIIPCALFDLHREEHQKICFHFSNYQPLTVADNRRKNDRLPDGSFARWSRNKEQFLP